MKIIIRTPEFDINLGGIIALHRLCHLLREEGVEAYLWPNIKAAPYNHNFLRTCYRFTRYWLQFLFGRRFKTYAQFNTPIAKYSDLHDAIVVYAEGVNGNPLNAKKVVRWFLHKPGFHTGEVKYGNNELYFFFHKAFNCSEVKANSDNRLRITMILDDIYKKTNFGQRKGTCYILRKGEARADVPSLEGQIVIDDMTHEEIANVFNKFEYCVSYDLYTMYSRYAVMCGCKSIVVPEKSVTKEQWRPDEEHRYGLSYGYDDLEYAKETEGLLLKLLKKEKEKEKEMVRNFIKTSQVFFLTKKKAGDTFPENNCEN